MNPGSLPSWADDIRLQLPELATGEHDFPGTQLLGRRALGYVSNRVGAFQVARNYVEAARAGLKQVPPSHGQQEALIAYPDVDIRVAEIDRRVSEEERIRRPRGSVDDEKGRVRQRRGARCTRCLIDGDVYQVGSIAEGWMCEGYIEVFEGSREREPYM